MKNGLTILIPVLNEADILVEHTRRLSAHLEGLGKPFEIILVSNGSTDETVSLGQDLAEADMNVHFYDLTKKGVGRAFALGVKAASFERIVSVDMDLSIDLDFIEKAIGLLDEYEIVVGSKKMGSQKRTLVRKLGSTAFIVFVRLLLGLPFVDYSIAAKAYRRQTIIRYLDLIDHGTSYVLDIIYHTLADGGRAIEIPVICEDLRVSKFNLVNEALYRFKNVAVLWWNHHLPRSSSRREGGG